MPRTEAQKAARKRQKKRKKLRKSIAADAQYLTRYKGTLRQHLKDGYF